MPTVRRLYPELAQRARSDGLSYRDFLAALMAEEVAHRAQTRIQRCVRRARFPFLKTIDEFDFTFQSQCPAAPCSAASSAPNWSPRAIASSPVARPGTGKTHLAVAIAYRAIQNGFEARFTTAAGLIESCPSRRVRVGSALPCRRTRIPTSWSSTRSATWATAPMPPTSSSTSSTSAALHHRPMLFTTNKPLAAWGRVLHDPDLAQAILDRVLERGRHLELRGPSYRTRH